MFIPHSRPSINKKEIFAVTSVLESCSLSLGNITRKFEKEFAKFTCLPYAVATNSGTSALHLALSALKIKPEDEVIIPSFVCSAVLNAVNYLGAVPKIADINKEDFNISVESVRKLMTRRTKAIIVAHMFGLAAKMDGLLKLGIPIIEDCALSIGAEYKNKKVGSFGLISIFSFYATKMMTTAEGGMLVTADRNLYSFVSDLRDYDNKETSKVRYNYKLSDVAAAIGLVQLSKLSSFISRRRKIARMYNNGLKDLNIQLPRHDHNKKHIYFRYIIKTARDASDIIQELRRAGIEAKRPVYKPLHTYLGLNNKNYPETNDTYRLAVSLPIYPSLKDTQVKFIIRNVRRVLKY